MAQLPSSFAIPEKYRDIVKQDTNSLDFLEILLKFGPRTTRANPELYHSSLTTKLYLEEASALYKFDRYNIDNVDIEHISNDTFRFKVNVSRLYFTSYFIKSLLAHQHLLNLVLNN